MTEWLVIVLVIVASGSWYVLGWLHGQVSAFTKVLKKMEELDD